MSEEAELVFQLVNHLDGSRSVDMTGTMTQIRQYLKLVREKNESADFLNSFVLIVGVVENDNMRIVNAPLFKVRSVLNETDDSIQAEVDTTG